MVATRTGPQQVTVRYRDGMERTVPVRRGQFVLDALREHGIPALHQCLSGTCGTCVARLAAGEMSMETDRLAVALLASERAEGLRLMCVSRPRGDCVIDLDYRFDLAESGPEIYPARVAALEQPAANVVKLVLELAAGDGFAFRGGQYARLQVPGDGQWRSYSFASAVSAVSAASAASASGDLPRLEFLVRLLPGGAMSGYLAGPAAVGDEILIEGPYGRFLLGDPGAPVIFVAGGTGLAPVIAMLDEIRVSTGGRPQILLSFGCATEENLFYLDELKLREFWMPNLEVRVSVETGAPKGSRFASGTPVDAFDAGDVKDPATMAYLCGPPGMIEAAHERLTGFGLSPDNIVAEEFAASGD